MKFLVTGGSGFVGQHMINRVLQGGHEVVAMIRDFEKISSLIDILGEENIKKIKFVYGDLTNHNSIIEVFLKYKFDGVFHLAAMAHPPTAFNNPLLAYQINSVGTAIICDSILEHQPQCVLMQCSTPAVYGRCPIDKKLDETTPINPNIPYGTSKASADLYVIERALNKNLRCFLTRAFTHAGPGRPENFCISSDAAQISRILLGYQEPVIKIGNMESLRTIIDVRDVADAYYSLMIEYLKGVVPNCEVFHIAGNELKKMQYYLDIMLELFGLADKVKLEIEPKYYRKNDNSAQIPDDSKIRRLINWEPKIKIEKTLQDLVDYWLNKLQKREEL